MPTAIRGHHTLADSSSSLRARPWLTLLGRCLVAAAGMMLCALSPGLVTAIPGLEAAADRAGQTSYPLAVAINVAILAVPLLAAAIVLPLVARIDKRSVRDYLGRVPAGRALGLGVATTAAAAAVAGAVVCMLRLAGVESMGAAPGPSANTPVLAIIVIGLAQAFLLQAIQEECWFRGFAFHDVSRRPWTVLSLTTGVFTLLHLASNGGQNSVVERIVYLVLPLGMGLWSGVERWCSGSVWPAIGVHGGMHTGILLAALAGSDTGLAGWVGIGAVFVGIAVARLAWVRPWLRPHTAGALPPRRPLPRGQRPDLADGALQGEGGVAGAAFDLAVEPGHHL